MTPERLQELIARGESLDVEFKGEEHGRLSDRDLIEAIVCLANRPGEEPGWLLIGVEDDGRITGARVRHDAGITDPYRVQALIASRTRPSLSCRVELLELDQHPVLAIEVPAARTPVGTTDGTYLRRGLGGRGEPNCLPYHFHEMQARAADRGMLDYSQLVIPEAGWDDLDLLEFERFRRSIRESGGLGDRSLLDLPDLELAKALGAVEANHRVTAVRVLGLLLFGKEEALRRLLPTHEVAFQVLSATRVEVNDFLRWPLVRVMDELMGHFRARYREDELMIGMQRVGIPNYPERAFREGVANALIHRDYTRLGAVHVQWHEDRVEFSNPGGFPEGVRLDNLLVTSPRLRNPLLADAFKRAGIVERTARGIDTIFYEQLRTGRAGPSYNRTNEASVVLVLPGGSAGLDFARLVVEESLAERRPDLDQLLILHHLWTGGRLTVPAAASLIQRSEGEARSVLEELVAAGLAEARGSGRARGYHLSAAAHRRLRDATAAIRDLGAAPAQLEELVLQYVAHRGRITRREAAELCRIGTYQASRLLARLAAEGKLELHGERRGAWYERRS